MGNVMAKHNGNGPKSTPGPNHSGDPSQPENPELTDREALQHLMRSIEASARRWQLVVFPSLFAFALLAAYGFYLIYNLVLDVHRMADSVANMGYVAIRMQQVSDNLDELTGTVRDISVNLDDLTGNIRSMNRTLVVISDQVETMPSMLVSMEQMNANIRSMDVSVQAMNKSVHSMNNLMGSVVMATQQINANMSSLNQNIGRPMSFMNSFMPW